MSARRPLSDAEFEERRESRPGLRPALWTEGYLRVMIRAYDGVPGWLARPARRLAEALLEGQPLARPKLLELFDRLKVYEPRLEDIPTDGRTSDVRLRTYLLDAVSGLACNEWWRKIREAAPESEREAFDVGLVTFMTSVDEGLLSGQLSRDKRLARIEWRRKDPRTAPVLEDIDPVRLNDTNLYYLLFDLAHATDALDLIPVYRLKHELDLHPELSNADILARLRSQGVSNEELTPGSRAIVTDLLSLRSLPRELLLTRLRFERVRGGRSPDGSLKGRSPDQLEDAELRSILYDMATKASALQGGSSVRTA